jgi:hypothetical protein
MLKRAELAASYALIGEVNVPVYYKSDLVLAALLAL